MRAAAAAEKRRKADEKKQRQAEKKGRRAVLEAHRAEHMRQTEQAAAAAGQKARAVKAADAREAAGAARRAQRRAAILAAADSPAGVKDQAAAADLEAAGRTAERLRTQREHLRSQNKKKALGEANKQQQVAAAARTQHDRLFRNAAAVLTREIGPPWPGGVPDQPRAASAPPSEPRSSSPPAAVWEPRRSCRYNSPTALSKGASTPSHLTRCGCRPAPPAGPAGRCEVCGQLQWRSYSAPQPRPVRRGRTGYYGPADVYERLASPAWFTGSHRERFDVAGNGLGLHGRDSPDDTAPSADGSRTPRKQGPGPRLQPPPRLRSFEPTANRMKRWLARRDARREEQRQAHTPHFIPTVNSRRHKPAAAAAVGGAVANFVAAVTARSRSTPRGRPAKASAQLVGRWPAGLAFGAVSPTKRAAPRPTAAAAVNRRETSSPRSPAARGSRRPGEGRRRAASVGQRARHSEVLHHLRQLEAQQRIASTLRGPSPPLGVCVPAPPPAHAVPGFWPAFVLHQAMIILVITLGAALSRLRAGRDCRRPC